MTERNLHHLPSSLGLDELGTWTCADQKGLAAEGEGPEAERGDLEGLVSGVGQAEDLRLLGSGDAVEGVGAVGVAHDRGGLGYGEPIDINDYD